MIPPLIFSLLAFFVVITTTVVVIKNKSKVNNINKSFNATKQQMEYNKHTNEHKLQNLVHEINLNNKKLENSQNNTKNELKLENRKTNEQMTNLNKRFNSYKNITTANLMGINNRMTSENERLQQDIDLNKELINQNRRDHRAGINSNAAEIFNTNNRITRFINDDYNATISTINSSHLSAVADIATLRSNITNSVIDSSNMNLDARILIRDDVRGRYNRTNDSLTNFFNFDRNFIENNYTYSSNNTLFRNWYDNYYNVASYSNFKKMDDLLLAADQDMNELRVERQRIDTLEGRATNIESSLHPDSNLYKSDLASFINSEYNFQLENLKNIQDNTQDITNLSNKVIGLSNLLSEISLVDATGDTITLSALNSNIQENSRKIHLNENAINEKFNRNFGTYLGSNLIDYYQTITDNLDETVLNTKIANKNHTFNTVTSKDITASNIISKNTLESENDLIFGGDLISGTTSYKNKIDNNENYTKTLDQVFSYKQVANTQHDTTSDSEITTDPMIRFIKPNDTEKEIKDSRLDFNDGVSIRLKNKKIGRDTNIPVGGKLFVDSWNDIGINKYNILGDIDNPKVPSTEFTIPNETLEDKFSNIDDQLATMSNDLSGFTAQQHNGMMKYQLYNLLNDYSTTDGLDGAYGRGKFEDKKLSSIRVKNLYTGEPTTVCTDSGNEIVNSANQCLTIDDRLKNLESVQTAAFSESLADNLRNAYSITTGASEFSEPLTIDKIVNAKQNVNITNSLSVGGNVSLNGDINVNGNMYVGNGSGKLILDNVNDLKVKSLTDTASTDDFQKYFVKKKNTSDSDDYVTNISTTPTGFEYTLSSGDTTPVSFPTSTAPTVESGDIKTFTPVTANLVGGSTNDISRFSYTTYNSSTSSFDVPNKYVYKIEDNVADNTFTVTQKNHNSDLDDTLVIDKGVSTREAIIDKLATGEGNIRNYPDFNSGIRFGSEGCIKMSLGKIQVCNSSCEGCVDIWDQNIAPAP